MNQCFSTQWRFSPGIGDSRKTTLRKHRFPVLHMVRLKRGVAKFRHPVDVSSMFFRSCKYYDL